MHILSILLTTRFKHVNRLSLYLIVFTFLSGCIATTSVDEFGRITVTQLGVMYVIPQPNHTQRIDLRNVSTVGIYADGSVTLGYADKSVGKVYLGCKALIITNSNTNHSAVVTLLNQVAAEDSCHGIYVDDNHDPQNKTASLQIGVSQLTQSLSYPDGAPITSYNNDFYGLEIGQPSGVGYRRFTTVSAGEACDYLIITKNKESFNYYLNNLLFRNRSTLCLTLSPV